MNTNNHHDTNSTNNAGFPPATPQATPSCSVGGAKMDVLPAAFFGDILDTALDCCEWLETKEHKISDPGEYTLSCVARPHWNEGRPFPKGDNRNDWTLVDHAKIEAAIQKIIDGELTNKPTRDTIFDAIHAGDTCNIDADCADAILQVAMFDELVFG